MLRFAVMDPELKTLLSALVDGQVRLAEGIEQTNAAMARGFAETNAAIVRLAEAQRETEKRMGWFAEQMLRGFDKVSTRITKAEDRLDKLEGE